ncbi:TCR/Tet family MFS transporter [Phenylobacterium terrae]|uniref:TCR/Tet family MFS transporter n=1 Tax=Phenylobacterium terrae TaxID=2665495 RepID=A0ABW4N3X2_9CAUL
MAEQTAAAPPARRAAFGFIFAVALINSISFGLMIPILPNLVKSFTGGDTAAASEWNVVFAVTWGLLQFFFAPFLGVLSDRVGRRPVLLVSLFGLAIDFLVMALAPNLMWLWIGRFINGLTAASMPTANAYVADVTPPAERAKAFGWIGSAMSFGFVGGPAIGGWLGDIDLRLPFYVAAALTSLNWLYGLLILPESHPPEKRLKKFDWSRANPLGSLRLLRSHHELVSLAAIWFLYQLAHMVYPAIFVLYMGHRYGWSPALIGLSMMVSGVLGVLVQSFLVGPTVQRLGERGALLLGAAAGATGMAIYGWAPAPWAYFAAMPFAALMALVIPGLQGMMTRRVGPHEQGQLQGANQGLTGIAALAGPILFGLTFAWSLRNEAVLQAPGLAIYIAAGLMVLAFVIALRTAKAPRPELSKEAVG